MFRIYENNSVGFISFVQKAFGERKRQCKWRKLLQDTYMNICIQLPKKPQKGKKSNTEQARTYEGLKTDNQPITGYLCTCSKNATKLQLSTLNFAGTENSFILD